MSPEQARGGDIDARSDIFSLGVVLYEMVAGRTPFKGANTIEVLAAILHQEPPALRQFAPDVPASLERIIGKAIRKDPADRYQTVKDLQVDLRAARDESATGAVSAQVSDPVPASTVAAPKGSRLPLLALLVAIVIAAAGGYAYFTRAPILTDKDTILLTEFENKTGEPVFDATLRQGLAVQLQQSPFLDILSDAKVRATMRLTSRSADAPVTRDAARDISVRQGLKAFIVGSIAKFDRNYSLTLEALNGQTGDSLALVQEEAQGKDDVLKALSRAASKMREKLGESLASIQKFDARLEGTTSSLEALQEYALARRIGNQGQNLKGAEHARRAVTLDPNFAQAWSALATAYGNLGQLAEASDAAEKAYALRDRVSEDERARIDFVYYQRTLGDVDKAIETFEGYVRNYPRDSRGPSNLGTMYGAVGQTEKAVELARAAIRIDSTTVNSPSNLAIYLMRLNRYSEAEDTLRDMLAKKMEFYAMRSNLHSLAFIKDDTAGMQEQLAAMTGKPDEFRAPQWQAQTAAFAGKWQQSMTHHARAMEMGLATGVRENAASFSADHAASAGFLGLSGQARNLAASALSLEHNQNTVSSAALAFALAGDNTRALSLSEELLERFPKNTIVNQRYLPSIRAAMAIGEGDPGAAVLLLDRAKRFEPNDEFVIKTLRARAYLKQNDGERAAAEFRSIIDHRGEGPTSPLWPLAHLGLGRALTMQGNTAGARRSYDEFFAMWMDADADIPVLIEARKEYAKLK